MAYNNYFPQFYPSAVPMMQPQQQTPVQPAQMPQNSSASSGTGITWVQGENAAKSFPVGAGQSVLLMDSEDSVMYIKSTDQSGMPMPLRVFDYTERQNERTTHANTVMTQNTDYISRSEFDAFKSEIRNELKQGNSTISKPTSKSFQNKREE